MRAGSWLVRGDLLVSEVVVVVVVVVSQNKKVVTFLDKRGSSNIALCIKICVFAPSLDRPCFFFAGRETKKMCGWV